MIFDAEVFKITVETFREEFASIAEEFICAGMVFKDSEDRPL